MKRGTLDAWLVPKCEAQPSPPRSDPSSTPTAPSTCQSEPVQPRTKADYSCIPAQYLGALLYVTDFTWTFRKLLRVGIVSVPEMKAAVETGGLEMKRLLRTVVRELVLDALLKASEGPLPLRLRLLHSLKSFLNLTLLTDQLTLSFAQEILLFHLDPDTALVERLNTYPLHTYLYSAYSYEERMEVLVNLVDLATESSSVHDVLGMRLDEKKELAQKKAELTAQMRALGKDAAVADQKALLKTEIKRLSAVIRSIPLRTEPLGYDRAENCYYRFGFDPTRVFVCRTGPDDYWFCYQTRDLQRKLARALKQPSEAALKSALERVIAEESCEMQQDWEEDSGTGAGTISCNEAVGKLLNLERLIWKFYEGTGKQWDTQETSTAWQQQVQSSPTFQGLGELLQALARKANSPLRQGNSRKGSARLWQECSEGLEAWSALCQSAESYSDLWLLACALEAVVEAGVRKKPAVLSQKDLG